MKRFYLLLKGVLARAGVSLPYSTIKNFATKKSSHPEINLAPVAINWGGIPAMLVRERPACDPHNVRKKNFV
jgi:hypothetical protein